MSQKRKKTTPLLDTNARRRRRKTDAQNRAQMFQMELGATSRRQAIKLRKAEQRAAKILQAQPGTRDVKISQSTAAR